MAKRKKLYLWITNLFIIAVVVVLLGTIYLTLARATIVVPADRESFTNETTIEITDDGDANSLSGDFVVSEYEASGTFPIGEVTTQSDKAGGVVTIFNEGSNNQILIATTRLLTDDDRLYRIQERVTVPAGGSVDVFAEADEEGDEFILKDQTRLTIPGLATALQSIIYAENREPLTFDRLSSSVVTQELINDAEVKLASDIAERAAADLSEEFGVTVKKEHITLRRTEISANPSIGQEGTSTEVSITAEISAVIVDENSLLNASEERLRNALPESRELIEVVPASLEYEPVAIDTENQTAQISTSLDAWIKAERVSEQIDTAQLAGKTIDEANAYLLSQGVQGAQIRLFPSWMPSLPLLESKIQIELK